MQPPSPNYVPWYLPPPERLHRTWSFWLACFVFILLSAKYISVLFHGYVGAAVVAVLAILVGLLEGQTQPVIYNIRRGMRLNSALLWLLVWYAIGLFLRMLMAPQFTVNWRYASPPIIILCAVLLGFGYLSESRASRLFQIAYILAIGVQSFFSGSVLSEGYGKIREIVGETMGSWSFGDQSNFAMQAVLLPMMIVRSLLERGWTRLLLLACCALITRTIIVCQFGTALGLLLLGGPLTVVIWMIWARKTIAGHFRFLIVAVAVAIFCTILIRQMQNNPMLEVAGSRVIRAWEDPRSGGYNATYAAEGSRWYLAQTSINTFKAHPFLGQGTGTIRHAASVGGHSALFDMLGFYGLLGGGGAFLLLILVMVRRGFIRMRQQANLEVTAALASLLMLFVAGVVNPYWEGEVTCLVFMWARAFRLPQEPR